MADQLKPKTEKTGGLKMKKIRKLTAIQPVSFLPEGVNVNCQKRSSGMTRQAVERLNKKVLDNLRNYCGHM